MGCGASTFDLLAPMKRDPSVELSGSFAFTPPPSGSSDYPPEMVLAALSPERREAIWRSACAAPKCRGLDPFSQLLYKAMHKLDSRKDFDEAKVGDYVLDSADLVKKRLDTLQFGCFRIPKYDEEADMTMCSQILEGLGMHITGYVRNEYMPPHYDPNSEHNPHGPVFFDSNEEAAVYFHACFRNHLPPLGTTVGVFEPCKMVDGDPAATAFTGYGQYFLRWVCGAGADATWPDRNASAACAPPAGTTSVIDLSWMAQYPVRKGFEQYGAAAFFSADSQLLGVWIEADSKLVLPPLGHESEGSPADAEFQFAVWRYKCTLFFMSFAPGHLTWIHWMCSNTMVLACREQLTFGHPVRRLLWPHMHETITINQAATIRLAAKQGAISRLSAIDEPAINAAIDAVAKGHIHRPTFDDTLKAMGQRPEGAAELPMARDGRKVWNVIATYVTAFLSLHYGEAGNDEEANKRTVASDNELQAFWTASNTSMGEDRPLGLPALSLEALRDYCVNCIFTVTALHELMGTVVMDVSLPTSCNSRILAKKHYIDPETGGLIRRPASSVQDYFRHQCVVGATTTLPMPKLIPSMRRAASVCLDPREGAVLVAFANALDGLAAEMEAEAATDKMPFGSFNPRRLEVSVSL